MLGNVICVVYIYIYEYCIRKMLGQQWDYNSMIQYFNIC